MSSITIHNIDHELDRQIRLKAAQANLSLNKIIKKILEEQLRIKARKIKDRRDDFIDMCGVWSKKDEVAFSKNIREFENFRPEVMRHLVGSALDM